MHELGCITHELSNSFRQLNIILSYVFTENQMRANDFKEYMFIIVSLGYYAWIHGYQCALAVFLYSKLKVNIVFSIDY